MCGQVIQHLLKLAGGHHTGSIRNRMAGLDYIYSLGSSTLPGRDHDESSLQLPLTNVLKGLRHASGGFPSADRQHAIVLIQVVHLPADMEYAINKRNRAKHGPVGIGSLQSCG